MSGENLRTLSRPRAMTSAECLIWLQHASDADIAAVERACEYAWADWGLRLQTFEELVEGADWCPSGVLNLCAGRFTAANAAGELAVICAVWPAPIATLRLSAPA